MRGIGPFASLVIVLACNDVVQGDAGSDTIYGRGGGDLLYGGFGNDTIYGGADDDYLLGGSGADTLYGEDGNDSLDSGGGGGTLDGGDGNDTLNAGYLSSDPAETLIGGAGNDTINQVGNGRADVVDAGAGSDRVYVGNYNGATATVTLGADSDTVVFSAGWAAVAYGNQAVITDFETGAGGDKIDLTQLLANLAGYHGSNPFGALRPTASPQRPTSRS